METGNRPKIRNRTQPNKSNNQKRNQCMGLFDGNNQQKIQKGVSMYNMAGFNNSNRTNNNNSQEGQQDQNDKESQRKQTVQQKAQQYLQQMNEFKKRNMNQQRPKSQPLQKRPQQYDGIQTKQQRTQKIVEQPLLSNTQNYRICQMKIIQKRLHKNKQFTCDLNDKPKIFKYKLKNMQAMKCIEEVKVQLEQQLLSPKPNELLQTFLLLSDMYLLNRDFSNSVYCSNHLRIASSLYNRIDFKILSLINLYKISKLANKLQYGLQFLKKGLEYAWYLGDDQTELRIYDWIGMIYFQMNNIHKSRFYHQRSVEGELEHPDSKQRKKSKQQIKTIVQSFRFRMKSGGDNSLLSLLGFQKKGDRIVNLVGGGEVFQYGTNMDYEYQFKNILGDNEFESQIQTPRSNYHSILFYFILLFMMILLIFYGVVLDQNNECQPINPQPTVLQTGPRQQFSFSSFQNSLCFNSSHKKKQFIEKYNKNIRISSHHKLRLKLSDEKLLEIRENNLKNQKKQLQFMQLSDNLNQFYHLNHQSANRNTNTYGYYCITNTKIIDDYFRAIARNDRQKE